MLYNMYSCGDNMEYLSVREISQKWNMKERRVTALCRDNRIAGIKKDGNTWLIPSDAVKPFDKRTKEFEAYFKEEKTITSYTVKGSNDRIVEAYKNKYLKEPMYTSFTPYRICFLGAHTDHNLGKTTAFAIDKGIHIAYNLKRNGIIEIESLQFPKRAQWHVLETPFEKENDWADHLRGATIELNKRYPLRYGLSAVIDGELPIGGLSSSGALIISFINALSFLNNIKLSKEELIDIVTCAEFNYVGISNGKLDQISELYAKKNNLLCIDFKDDSFELIETPKNMDKFEIGIFFSGLDKSMTSKKYNMRVDELRSAAYMLKALSGMKYSKFEETNMRDVPYEVYLKYKNNLPIGFSKRAEHFYQECDRVEKGIEAYKRGNLIEFGKLINESGDSSINNWETGSEEMIKLHEILKNTKGVYGTRFAGSGFKGCCIAIINPKYKKEIIESVTNEYLSIYPMLRNKYSAHICHTADGVKL